MQRSPTILFYLLLSLLAGACSEGPDREELLRIEAVLAPIHGQSLADIGTGDGQVLPFYSGLVGASGTVYGTELGSEQVDVLKRKVESGFPSNIVIREAGITDIGLPAGCCDVIVMRHVYHHLTAPAKILDSIHAGLKPGGRLLVIDFQPTVLLAPWMPEGIPGDRGGHGVTPDIVAAEAAQAGFRTGAVLEDWPGGHLLMKRFAVLLQRDR